jgi:hypothetical protein
LQKSAGNLRFLTETLLLISLTGVGTSQSFDKLLNPTSRSENNSIIFFETEGVVSDLCFLLVVFVKMIMTLIEE